MSGWNGRIAEFPFHVRTLPVSFSCQKFRTHLLLLRRPTYFYVIRSRSQQAMNPVNVQAIVEDGSFTHS